jgi:hypothetical protein
VFWRLGVPAVHELAVTHNQQLLYVSRRAAGQLAVVRLHPDATVLPDRYDDVLPLGLPDTLRLSANEQLLTVGLRSSPARLAVVDTRVLEACDGAPCAQAVNTSCSTPVERQARSGAINGLRRAAVTRGHPSRVQAPVWC